MKNTIKAAAVIALSLFAAACAKETKIESPAEGQKLHFTVNTAENAVVKSFLEDNLGGTYTPKWSKGDVLAIFVGAIGEKTKPTGVLSNVNEKGTLAKFEGTVTGIEGSGTFKSFTPASAFAKGFDSGNVGITLAESQKPSSLTIDEACDILVAKEANYTEDANGNGKVTVNDLFFKRMFSVVKVALKGPATLNGEKVQKFSFTAPEGTVLTGCAVINLSTATVEEWTISNNTVTAAYATDAPVFGSDTPGLGNVVWLVVNPGTIASGAKLTFAGETAGYTFSKEVTLSKALIFPESQLAVINLTLADEHCTKKATPAAASWIATDLADITATDEVVITMANGESVYAMTSDKGTSDNPQAVLVTVKDGELSATPADNLVWNIANDNGNLTIYPNGQTDKWLYSATSGTNVRVGNSKTNNIFTLDAKTKYLKNTGNNRYLGVYSNSDWRAYAGTTGNAIAGQTLCFYVKGTPKTALETPANLAVSAAKVVSWDAVSGAASYELTIGKDVFTSETNSYDATAVVDDYYDVAVVAIPSDKENYKNSAAATLGGAKFGTPTLATPTLKEGVVDGASISVSWTVDERATAGYNSELFKGEVKVGEGQIVNAGTVTFTGLDAETAYVVKVNAVAVEGTKAYAASPVATLEVTTKAATATANDGSLERPYTAAEAIAAIDANTGLTGKYVKGIVKAAPSFDARYNSLTYDIESGAKTLNIYSGKDLGDAGFVGAEDLKAGDEVVVFGNLKKYNKVYELDKNNYLISINGETQIYRGLAVSAPKTTFTVGDAFELGGKVLQVWRGKEDVDVTASATVSGYDMSTEGKQTVTVTVGEESVTYEINVRAAGAETPKTYTLQFGSEYNGAKANGYSNNWSVTCDGFTWKMTNWNNNNNGWTYVKAGPKGNTNAHAKIETAAAMPEAISKISITIDKVENGSITSIVLKSSTTDDFTSGTTIETKTSVQQGEVVFSIPSPQNGLYYQLDFTLNNTTSNDKKGKNGVAQVSKVVYTNN